MSRNTVSARLEELVGAAVEAALADVEAARAEPYYDEAADRGARERYYGELTAADGEPLRAALAERLERTHEPRPAYRPMQCVCPRVDVHPDGLLRSIYSGKTFSPEEADRARRDDRARQDRAHARVQPARDRGGTQRAEGGGRRIEASLPYNCEHVACQSWFDEDEPMRGDIHHLFACESGCNSFRGNFPYLDFPDTQEIVRDACGRREDDGFAPSRQAPVLLRPRCGEVDPPRPVRMVERIESWVAGPPRFGLGLRVPDRTDARAADERPPAAGRGPRGRPRHRTGYAATSFCPASTRCRAIARAMGWPVWVS